MNTSSDMVTVFVVRPRADKRSHEFLQLHREANDYLGNTWQFVRGQIESDETAIAAALRELKEEAGLVPLEFYRLGAVESFYLPPHDTLWHSVPFVAYVARDARITLNEEHDDFRWIPRDRIFDEMMWTSERSLFNDLCRDILDSGIAKPHLKINL